MKKFVLPYGETGYFSKAVTDYLAEKEELKPFYRFPVAAGAIPQLLTERAEYLTHRDELHLALTKQHEPFRYSDSLKPVHDNINPPEGGEHLYRLLPHTSPTCFSVPCILFIKSSAPSTLRNHSVSNFLLIILYRYTGWEAKTMMPMN
jgi:hypothetical protein